MRPGVSRPVPVRVPEVTRPGSPRRAPRLAPLLAAALLVGPLATRPAAAEAALAATACVANLPAGTRCYGGRDALGSYLAVAVPPSWNGVLVVHAHGGPELGTPDPKRVAEDLERWRVMVRAGYAWAGTTFHQGGVAVRSAAADVEEARRLALQVLDKPPRRTLLHGNSWGASVAARAAESDPGPWSGVLLTSGVLGGGSRSYDFRLDLRVVYEAVCGNHPAPGEHDYPLWQGLPPGARLTSAELASRVDACTGVRHPRGERSAEQQHRLDTLLKVIRIPESSLVGHLAWGTFHFRDIASKRLDGGNAFGNEGVRYSGSDDDEALNRAVRRYRRDPAAAARFAADTDPTGRIPVPVLTLHAIEDPTAFVELEGTFRDTMEAAGRGADLVQAFTRERAHSYLADPEYVAALAALLDWIERGSKPTPQALAERCRALEPTWGAGCAFDPDYRPPPLAARVPPR
jgi:alpha-beta hydrolase superfamily lysophospholipase